MARLAALVALTLLVPFGVRALDARFGDRATPASYVPALEGPRTRTPFDSFPRDRMTHYRPELVVIGDSMAGTRIDAALLEELSGRRVYAILHAGSGSAFWYLALKNWVIASGARPKVVFIFFRDTNLTDVMFRMDTWNVDRVALDREPDLNDAIASRLGEWRQSVTARVESVYRADRARLWMTSAIGDAVARLAAGEHQAQAVIIAMNERFDFERLRPMEAADIALEDDATIDFGRYVDRSVLPLMLRDARAAGITLCFVRAQRRPAAGRPPRQSAALRAYVADLSNYVRAQGGMWRDDTGDPSMSLDMYGDGDHLARHARERYTTLFWTRVGPHLN